MNKLVLEKCFFIVIGGMGIEFDCFWVVIEIV